MCRADLKRGQSVSRKHGYRQPGDSGCAKSQHSVDDYKKRSLREMLQRMSTAYRGVTVATALVGFLLVRPLSTCSDVCARDPLPGRLRRQSHAADYGPKAIPRCPGFSFFCGAPGSVSGRGVLLS